MKSILQKTGIALFGLAITLTSCQNNGNSTSSGNDSTIGGQLKEAGKSIGNAAAMAGDKIKDAADSAATRVKNLASGNYDSTFTDKATTSNNEEIKLLQAGIDNGTNKDLKSDARKMLADHKKLKDQLHGFAMTVGYPSPTTAEGKGNDDMDNMNKHTKGSDWDKAWADLMVREHKDDINSFQKAQNNVKDHSLKQIVDNTLPILNMHLSMAETLQNNLK